MLCTKEAVKFWPSVRIGHGRFRARGRREGLGGFNGIGEQVVIVGQRYVGRGDLFARKESSVEGSDGRHGGRDGGALDVNVSIPGVPVDVDVKDAPVLGALFDHLIFQLSLPVVIHVSVNVIEWLL